MSIGGYNDKVARIDLSSGEVAFEPVNPDYYKKYVGGRGLGVRYVYDNGVGVDPLSPDNLLAVMTGPLTGTDAKMSGRLAVVTRSPLTGTVTDSHMGGWTAAHLKEAGLDALLIKGKADKPTYLYVEDGKVTLHDASEVWGKGVHDTVKALRAIHGEKASVMAIGQAGENQVRFAGWINDMDRAAGRGGTGAVGGSKNLKAIVIQPNRGGRPKPANRETWGPADKAALASITNEAVVTAPRKGGLSVYGTNVLMNIVNNIGALPANNSKLTSFGEKAELVSGEYVNEHIKVGDPTCHACPVACKKEVEVTEGPYKVHMESVEYEPAWSLGANCGNDNVESIAYIIDLCNDYGMDPIELGNCLSVVMEATELDLLDGQGLAWGDHAGMTEMTSEIALRSTDLGDKLAFGAAGGAERIGKADLAMSVKGQAIPAYDPRGIKGMGIGYATSNRGACHLRGYTPAAEVVGNVLGPAETVDPLAWEGKGELLATFQNVHAMTDSLDVCKFSTFAESMQNFADQMSAMTGDEWTPEDLMTVGERVYNLERHYNNLHGFGEGSDYLPKRFTEEPSTMPGSEGEVCELDKMLVEYYTTRGWVDGVVPDEKIESLDVL
jgi:aldehyde:ferredoxin oxidoreductase